jgi:hypothetical protein
VVQAAVRRSAVVRLLGGNSLVLVAVALRFLLTSRLERAALSQARRGLAGSMEVHLPDAGVSWNYTTWLNIAFLVLAAIRVIRFIRTGGVPMLRMMGGPPPEGGEAHDHGGHDHGGHDHGGHDHGGHDHGGHEHGGHEHGARAHGSNDSGPGALG